MKKLFVLLVLLAGVSAANLTAWDLRLGSGLPVALTYGDRWDPGLAGFDLGLGWGDQWGEEKVSADVQFQVLPWGNQVTLALGWGRDLGRFEGGSWGFRLAALPGVGLFRPTVLFAGCAEAGLVADWTPLPGWRLEGGLALRYQALAGWPKLLLPARLFSLAPTLTSIWKF